MTNEESTEIVSFLTPGVGGLVSGFGQFGQNNPLHKVCLFTFIDCISGSNIVVSLVLNCNPCGIRYIKYNKYLLQNRVKLSFLYL